jgi:hypothetical protein
MLTGCFQTDKSLLEDVTDYQYKLMVCVQSSSSCDAVQINLELEDAKAKAEIAGISEQQIFAALKFGETKAERELSKLREIQEKEFLKKREELENKCTLENKVVCDDRCCTKEEFLAIENASAANADAATAAADAAAAEAAAAAVDAAASEVILSSPNLGAELEKSMQAEKVKLAELIASIDGSTKNNPRQPSLLPINIKQGMEYGQARKVLFKSGWQAVNANKTPNGAAVCFLVAQMQDWSFSNEVACNYYEIVNCSGTGMGYCKMIFYDGNGGFLSVITSGGRPPDAVIENWTKEPSFEAEVIPLEEISNYKN